MFKKKPRRRSVRRRKKSPETIFWMVLVAILVLAGTGFLAHNVLFASGGPASWLAALTAGRNNEVAIDSVEVAENISEQPEVVDAAEDFLNLWEPKEPTTHHNILLLGLDNHGMSDVIMIFTYDLQTFDSALLSIKRDTYVDNQTWARKDSGQGHLAWASNRGMLADGDYDDGANLAAYTVENLLGIELHNYAAVSFEGFTEFVDLIGGVQIEVDPEFAGREGRSLPTGLQRLDGEQALVYARHRQNPRIPEPGSTSQDGDRVRRNQRLLKAMMEQCKTMGSDELMHVVEQLDNKFYTSLDDWDILDMINILYNRNPDEIETFIMPGEGERVYQERIERNIYYYFLDFDSCDMILEELGLK